MEPNDEILEITKHNNGDVSIRMTGSKAKQMFIAAELYLTREATLHPNEPYAEKFRERAEIYSFAQREVCERGL